MNPLKNSLRIYDLLEQLTLRWVHMVTNTSYNLCLKELRTLETYKIKNQEQQHTSFTTTQVRRMLGTT